MILKGKLFLIENSRADEVRGRRKLEYLDIFSSLINGNNKCTACFLHTTSNCIYISVNEDDEKDGQRTEVFANNYCLI
jgi:hypothetical protein